MLRNLLIVSSSGIVLFSKDFGAPLNQPRLLGGLITAMMKSSVIRTGLPVSLIEMSEIAVAIATDVKYKMTCSLFYEKRDGPEFGRLLASEILRAFIGEYSTQLAQISANLKDFSPFNQRISETIRGSLRPALRLLVSKRGVNMALVVSGDSIIASTQEVDKVGVVANLESVYGISVDIMGSRNDHPLWITMHSQSLRIVVKQIERSLLIVSCKASADAGRIDREIHEVAKLLQKILILDSNLQDWWSLR